MSLLLTPIFEMISLREKTHHLWSLYRNMMRRHLNKAKVSVPYRWLKPPSIDASIDGPYTIHHISIHNKLVVTSCCQFAHELLANQLWKAAHLAFDFSTTRIELIRIQVTDQGYKYPYCVKVIATLELGNDALVYVQRDLFNSIVIGVIKPWIM